MKLIAITAAGKIYLKWKFCTYRLWSDGACVACMQTQNRTCSDCMIWLFWGLALHALCQARNTLNTIDSSSDNPVSSIFLLFTSAANHSSDWQHCIYSLLANKIHSWANSTNKNCPIKTWDNISHHINKFCWILPANKVVQFLFVVWHWL